MIIRSSLRRMGRHVRKQYKLQLNFVMLYYPHMLNAQDEKELKRLMEEGTPTSFLSKTFGIKKVSRPMLGYLFDPIYQHTGIYVLSLFEDSKIEGCKFLLKEGGI